MLQELPYDKRQGASIARAWANKLCYDVNKATSEACGLLNSLEFIPAVSEALKNDPDSVIAKMNEMRQHRESCRKYSGPAETATVLDPSILRVSVSGDILKLPKPKSTLAEKFLPIKVDHAGHPVSRLALIPSGIKVFDADLVGFRNLDRTGQESVVHRTSR